MTMLALNNTAAHLYLDLLRHALFAQSIPFTRRSRLLIGLKYSGEREARLFPVPGAGKKFD